MRTDTRRTRTPEDVYSRALLLTSIRDSPTGARVALHTIADELAHTARRTDRRCDMSANQATQMQTRSLRRAPSMAYRPLITPKSERCSSQMQPAGTCKRRRYERTADRSSIREHPRYQARAQETSTRAATRRRNGRAQAQSRCQTRNEACMRRGSHHQANSRGCRRAQDREKA